MLYNHIRRGAPGAPARRLTFSTRALAVGAAGVLLLTGASSAMAQTPSPAGAVDPDIANGTAQHAIVQQAINDRVERLGVTYDARGVPQSISIDRRLMIADDEITYRITGFTVDPRSRLLVAFHRTGGFIGVDDRLSVARDGLAIRTARTGVA
ncbi:MAG: DUF6174 domain-containing protein [Solirubrobacteraceae bacterium]